MVSLIEQGVDWDGVIQMGLRHRVLPRIYWSLKTACPGAVPEQVLKRLREYYYHALTRNLFHIQELLRILTFRKVERIIAIAPSKARPCPPFSTGTRVFGYLMISISCCARKTS